jgi:hypothetical protein
MTATPSSIFISKSLLALKEQTKSQCLMLTYTEKYPI